MSHKFFIIVLLMMFCIPLLADNSDEFLIGTYSHYKQLANHIDLPVNEVANAIAQFLEDANYNHVQACEHPEIFLNHNINPIVSDGRIKQPPLYNDCSFEAEYITDGLPNSNINWPNEWPLEMKWY